MLSGFLIYTVSGIIAWQFAIPEKDAIKKSDERFHAVFGKYTKK